MQRASQRFSRFANLPPELRIQIWQETCPRPGFHAFDVHIPSNLEGSRITEPFKTKNGISIEDGTRIKSFATSISLGHLRIAQRDGMTPTDKDEHCNEKLEFYFDPSAYRVRNSVRLSCYDAFSSLQMLPKNRYPRINETKSPPNSKIDSNFVYLPATKKLIAYDNNNDVLFLRFGKPIPSRDLPEDDDSHFRIFNSGLSDILLFPWSQEFAETLRNARRVAIDIAEMALVEQSDEAMYQEIACLSSCLQDKLEVLYAVDHCVGQCRKCEKGGLNISSLQTKGGLANQLSSLTGDRHPDVFHGNGVTYHEISALEKLGWSKEGQAFRVLKMFAQAIQHQQGHSACFRGVRLLACQHDG